MYMIVFMYSCPPVDSVYVGSFGHSDLVRSDLKVHPEIAIIRNLIY